MTALVACTAWQTSEPPDHLIGVAASPALAQRSIVILPQTRHVNVTGGETIRFVAGEQSFAWSFQVASTVSAFLLNRVAPPGMLDHPVRVYVAPDPRYISDGHDKGRGR